MAVKGLVLSGGGSRGSYHAGVWKALDELGESFDVATGSSVGALSAAMYAQGELSEALRLWNSVKTDSVVRTPKGLKTRELAEYLKRIAKDGGMDVTPLERMVQGAINEQRVRASRVRFGMVTLSLEDLSPRELTEEKIPEGRLVDYILGSAAAFPAFRPKIIDGEKFIDGGYYDNMPLALAMELGADELVAVSLDAIGRVRDIQAPVPVRTIRSHWDLGNFLKFSPETIKRNIVYGYNDAMKAYGRFDGTSYTFEKGETESFGESECARLIEQNRDMWIAALGIGQSAVIDSLRRHMPREGKGRRAAVFAEKAGEVFGVDPRRVYKFSDFCRRIEVQYKMTSEGDLRSLNPKSAAKYMAQRMEQNGLRPEKAIPATAALMPNEYIAACYIAASHAAKERQ